MPNRTKLRPGANFYFVLVQLPRTHRPRHYFTDQPKFPLEGPTTLDLRKARVWNERTGPFTFLKRHPEMKRKFYALAMTAPQPVAA